MLKELSVQLKNTQSKTSLERFKSPASVTHKVGTKSIFNNGSPSKQSKMQSNNLSPKRRNNILAHDFDQ